MLLYIDPGTGSMLFTILVSLLSAGIYSVRVFFLKLRQRINNSKVSEDEDKVPFVIFSDDKRYWQIFEPICRELNNKKKKILYITASSDDPVLKCKYENMTVECIENTNRLFARLNFLNAGILLSTTPGLDVYQWKRSKNIQYYVHIPHAPNDITLYRMFGIDYYDAILLSGDYQEKDIRNLEKIRNLKNKELIKVGIPYMDEMKKRFDKSGSFDKHPTTVLLAPSWGKSAMLSVYGGRIIKALLNTGYHIIVRPHPQSFKSESKLLEKIMEEYPESDLLEWNRDMDNFEVLRRSDIIISDFSGVIFEFALIYDKPVIYTNPKFNLDCYDAWWLDTPLWTETALKKIGCELKDENIESVKELIDTCLTETKYKKGRDEIKKETWGYCGEGAKRTVEYLLKKHDELSRQSLEV